MQYSNTYVATFLSRPNRFLAHVMLDGGEIVCHVKNTGRLRELLIPGASVIVQHHPGALTAGRKTEYSLIGVAKPVPQIQMRSFAPPHAESSIDVTSSEELQSHKSTATSVRWVNIDSQAPNQVVYEWLMTGDGFPFSSRPQNVRREVKYGDSRFDLSFTVGEQKWLMEVKGVTLDMDGTAKFPDAPTERGIKHLDELGEAVKDGFQTAVLFVIQMKGISAFAPHAERHPEFAEALVRAKKHGVHVWAYDCVVTENTMVIDQPVPVIFPIM